MQPFETETGNPKTQATYPTLEQNPQSQGQTPQPQDQNSQNQGQQYPQQPQVQNQYPQGPSVQHQGQQYPQQPQVQNQYPQQGQYPQYQGQQYPQSQGQYPQQGQYSKPQGQYPQGGQYPQAQRPSYPQNYQAPYPNRGPQYPGGYPNYQAQPQYVIYDQGANKGHDTFQRQMMMQRLSRNNKSSGGGLVALYSLFVAAIAGAVAYSLMNQTNYQVLATVYQKIAGRDFNPADSFSNDTCQAFLADIIAAPIFLFGFAAFNLFAMFLAFTGLTCCMVFQGFATLAWAGMALFVSAQKCVGYSIITSMFGADNIPQNAFPYYAAMAGASLIASVLNYSWSSNKDKAQRDQRNLALMMAAS